MNFNDFGLWHLLTIAAIICLVISLKSRNAIWGGATGGTVVGIVVSVANWMLGNGFSWLAVGKGVVIGALIGAGTEALSLIRSKLRGK